MAPLLFLAAILPLPAAQPRLQDVMHNVLGDCGLPADGTVIVCGKRNVDPPYRLPPGLRDPGFRIDGPVDSVARERHKMMDFGAAGTQSCSAAGAGGWTGCMVDDWERADEQRGFRRPTHEPKP